MPDVELRSIIRGYLDGAREHKILLVGTVECDENLAIAFFYHRVPPFCRARRSGSV